MNIQSYNDIVTEIVYDFAKRYYREVYEDEMNQEDWLDVNIHEYHGILGSPIYFYDNYFSLDDIIMVETHQIPCKVYEAWYDLYIETDGIPGINLYNYWQKYKDPEAFTQKQAEDLKRSEENVKKSQEYFEEAIESFKLKEKTEQEKKDYWQRMRLSHYYFGNYEATDEEIESERERRVKEKLSNVKI